MAAMYATWKRVGQVRLDGIRYDIGARQREDGRTFLAWVCLACCDQGPPAPAFGSTKQAIDFAKIGLRAHHALFHRNAKPTVKVECLTQSPCAPLDLDCKSLDSREAAFARVKAMFGQLRAAYAELQNGDPRLTHLPSSSDSSPQECIDWTAAAREFQAALKVFSNEVDKRACELQLFNAGVVA
jgi:hypothetical protein